MSDECIICKKEILDTDIKFMIAIETPYINIMVHRLCWREHNVELANILKNSLDEYINKQKPTKNKKK